MAGEAAGLSLGLLYAGSGTDKAAELLAYAHETQVGPTAMMSLRAACLGGWTGWDYAGWTCRWLAQPDALTPC